MTYYRRGATRAPLTPPAELVGRLVGWRPKDAQGRRMAEVLGWCDSHDAEARTLTVRVPVAASPWSPASERIVTVKLSSGPFRVLS